MDVHTALGPQLPLSGRPRRAADAQAQPEGGAAQPERQVLLLRVLAVLRGSQASQREDLPVGVQDVPCLGREGGGGSAERRFSRESGAKPKGGSAYWALWAR